MGTMLALFGVVLLFAAMASRQLQAGCRWFSWCHHCSDNLLAPCPEEEPGGVWYWMRSPEEEHRVVAAFYNRYCIRCHAVDGRGVWDIPGVPDFTNAVWQGSRSDAQLARIILEGRGAVMPPFRGTFSLEEAWAMGRYLRTLVPGTEASRPDLGKPGGQSNPPAGGQPRGDK
jgi:hypothetical protein